MSARRRGLGRGLDALLGTDIPAVASASGAMTPGAPASDLESSEGAAQGVAGLREVAVDDLVPNRLQPRTHFADKDLASLSASIEAQGVLQPLIVMTDADGHYSIIAGERRWRAARMAGLETVPVVVRDVADDQSLLEMALVENVQRADLDVIEEAEAYRLLAERFDLSQEAIAQRVGKSRPTVTNTLRLLRLPPEVQALLRDGLLTAGQARPLLGLTDRDQQLALAKRTIEERLTARDIEKLAAKGDSKPPAKPAPDEPDVHTRAAIDRLTRALQTRVDIRRRRRGGEILIAFHSEDELIRLFDRLTQGKGDP